MFPSDMQKRESAMEHRRARNSQQVYLLYWLPSEATSEPGQLPGTVVQGKVVAQACHRCNSRRPWSLTETARKNVGALMQSTRTKDCLDSIKEWRLTCDSYILFLAQTCFYRRNFLWHTNYSIHIWDFGHDGCSLEARWYLSAVSSVLFVVFGESLTCLRQASDFITLLGNTKTLTCLRQARDFIQSASASVCAYLQRLGKTHTSEVT